MEHDNLDFKVVMADGAESEVTTNSLKSLEPVKGIEPSSSAWKGFDRFEISTPVTEKQQYFGSLIENDNLRLPEWRKRALTAETLP